MLGRNASGVEVAGREFGVLDQYAIVAGWGYWAGYEAACPGFHAEESE